MKNKIFLSIVVMGFMGLTACSSSSDSKAPAPKAGNEKTVPAPIELQGTWTGSLDTDEGRMNLGLTIKADGTGEIKNINSGEISKTRVTQKDNTWYFVDEAQNQLLRFELTNTGKMTIHLKDDSGAEVVDIHMTKVGGPVPGTQVEPNAPTEQTPAPTAPQDPQTVSIEKLTGIWFATVSVEGRTLELQLVINSDSTVNMIFQGELKSGRLVVKDNKTYLEDEEGLTLIKIKDNKTLEMYEGKDDTNPPVATFQKA